MPEQCHVVFVSRQRLVGRTNGSSAYLLDLANAVDRAGLTSSLIQPSPSLFGRMPILRLRPEMSIFSRHHVRGSIRLGRYLVALSPSIWISAVHGVLAKAAGRAGINLKWLQDRKAPYSIAMPWTQADKAYAASHIPDGSIVIADYIFQTEVFDVLGPKARSTATIMHDLFHPRAEMAVTKGTTDSVASINMVDEVAMLGRADLVIAIQQSEAGFVEENLPGQPVITVPISFSTVHEPRPGNAAEILFVGSNTEPNISGLKWFLQNCWPKVLDSVPGAKLNVAGTVSLGMRDFSGTPSVNFLGVVDDLAQMYDRSGVVISPLTFGSGLKIKLIEAMALGKAIVATSITLQGVEDIATHSVCKANDPDDFASTVIALAQDENLRIKMGQRALSKAKKHFSASAAQEKFVTWLKEQLNDIEISHENE
ncbi:glycosyltransferase family 4 protein [Palleronia abyssalis]|uniref:Glycosyltransferase subfamily 4-like N-terminal domain-containing protein n=1 Tax=Palleronia abyssalis TaxID=1501240 RepID=A0A2R8BZD1_9RHOB|nr:glycosyltransferase family 4 protein [Palleronia abyssalis]SPJ25525.1 hypothetical protein PAA8504_03376 [Palleronia abyssalis]